MGKIGVAEQTHLFSRVTVLESCKIMPQPNRKDSNEVIVHLGGAVAEWSKALYVREKTTQKVPGSPLPGQFLK